MRFQGPIVFPAMRKAHMIRILSFQDGYTCTGWNKCRCLGAGRFPLREESLRRDDPFRSSLHGGKFYHAQPSRQRQSLAEPASTKLENATYGVIDDGRRKPPRCMGKLPDRIQGLWGRRHLCETVVLGDILL